MRNQITITLTEEQVAVIVQDYLDKCDKAMSRGFFESAETFGQIAKNIRDNSQNSTGIQATINLSNMSIRI
jgi:uncharacterized protein YoaH (UPF0181 family)